MPSMGNNIMAEERVTPHYVEFVTRYLALKNSGTLRTDIPPREAVAQAYREQREVMRALLEYAAENKDAILAEYDASSV